MIYRSMLIWSARPCSVQGPAGSCNLTSWAVCSTRKGCLQHTYACKLRHKGRELCSSCNPGQDSICELAIPPQGHMYRAIDACMHQSHTAVPLITFLFAQRLRPQPWTQSQRSHLLRTETEPCMSSGRVLTRVLILLVLHRRRRFAQLGQVCQPQRQADRAVVGAHDCAC